MRRPPRTIAAAGAIVGLALLILAAPASADPPTPWDACSGKALGDSCGGADYPGGVCRQADAGCPQGVKTCLWCVVPGGGGGCAVVGPVGAQGERGTALGHAAVAALALLLLRLRRPGNVVVVAGELRSGSVDLIAGAAHDVQ